MWRTQLATLDALLQSRDGECLHDRLRRLRLDQPLLTEDDSLASFRGRLVTGLDRKKPREREFANVFQLLGARLSKNIHDRSRNLGLELELVRNGLGNGAPRTFDAPFLHFGGTRLNGTWPYGI